MIPRISVVVCSPNFVSYGNGSIYLMDPAKHGFRESDAPAIGDDKYIGIGISKGVKVSFSYSKKPS